MNETLSVNAIRNGSVIDHISPGQALRIIYLLALQSSNHTITIGLHLPSKRLGTKDLIKIENHALSEEEANEVVVFAPNATINVIENFKVVKKINTRLPDAMRAVFICPNTACITQAEPVDSFFYIDQQNKSIKLVCHYCNHVFDRDQVKVKI